MPRISLLCLLLLLILVLPIQAGNAQDVTAVQAMEMLQREDKPFLLDVRTEQEFREVHLADATLIPIGELAERISEIPKSRPILIYCAVGSRSSQATGYLARSGYGPVYNLYGGIWAWQLHGLPVEKGGTR